MQIRIFYTHRCKQTCKNEFLFNDQAKTHVYNQINSKNTLDISNRKVNKL